MSSHEFVYHFLWSPLFPFHPFIISTITCGKLPTYLAGSGGGVILKVTVSFGAGTGEARKVSVDVYLSYDDAGLGEAVEDGLMCSQADSCASATPCGGESAEFEVGG